MAIQDFVHLLPYVLSAATSIAIAGYAWGRTVPGSRQFAVLAIAQAVATVGFIFEITSDELEVKLFWTNIQTIAFFVWPMAYFAFALKFTGRDLAGGRRTWILLATPFLIFLLLLFTDSSHGLIRPDVYIEHGEPFSALIINYTVPIYIAGIYSYFFIVASLYMLAKKYLDPSALHRGQIGTVLVGTSIPVVVGIFITAGIRVGFQSDPTPLAFALGNLVVAWGLYRYRLFELVPLARESIVESMRDGVIVLDQNNVVVDVNPAVRELLGRKGSRLVGKSAEAALAPWPKLLNAIANNPAEPFEMEIDGRAVLQANLESIDERRGVPGGQMLVLHDITDRKQLESELVRHQDHLEELIAERTEDLSQANRLMQQEVEERSRAERELIASESRITQFLNALPMAVLVVGADTKLSFMNDFAMELYGRGPTSKPPIGPEEGRRLEEVLKELRTFEAGSEEPLPPEQSPSLRALKGERVRLDNVEVQLRSQRMPIEMLSVPIRNESGEIEFAITAIQNVDERRRLEETLDATYKLGRDLALIRDENDIVRRVVEEAHHLLDFELAGFGLADEPACELIYGYSIIGTDEQETELRLPLGGKHPQSISAKVYRTGELMNVPDVSKEPLYHLETEDWDGRSELCVPIRVGDQILGVLNAESRKLNRFNRDDERLLQALADQCGVAVENARLYSELQQRLREQTALQNAVSSISAKIELEPVLNEIARRLGESIDATSAFICAYDQTRMTTEVLAHYAGPGANDKERHSPPEGTYSLPEFFPGTVEKLIANEPAVSYADDTELPSAQRKHYDDYDAKTSLFIPMRIGGRLVAYADLWDSQDRRSFTPQEIALCEGIAQQAAVAMENARLYSRAQEELVERKRVERQLQEHQEELEQLVLERTAKLSEAGERLATLNDASHVLGVASTDPDQVHRAIHQAVSWLMSAETFCITVVDHDKAEARDVYVAGVNGTARAAAYPVSESFVEYMFDRGQSLRIDDVEHTTEPPRQVIDHLDAETRSVLAVLLPGSDQHMGIMLAQCKKCDSYSEEDEKILEMLAAHAATAIENAQLYQVAQRAAADEERQRLARHLHDSVTQSLYSLTLMTNGWAAMSEKGELSSPAESFRQLEQLGVQALSEMRLLIHQLRPPVLEETGLVGALQERLEAVEHRVGLETQLVTEGDVEQLPRQVEEELFHITQEALNNALRHAEASNIWVRIAVDNGSTRLAIEDDGRGFDPNRVNGGLGLTTMRERAESLGGEFQLSSGSGSGTVVEVLLGIGQGRKER